jgi:hypothetical protein
VPLTNTSGHLGAVTRQRSTIVPFPHTSTRIAWNVIVRRPGRSSQQQKGHATAIRSRVLTHGLARTLRSNHRHMSLGPDDERQKQSEPAEHLSPPDPPKSDRRKALAWCTRHAAGVLGETQRATLRRCRHAVFSKIAARRRLTPMTARRHSDRPCARRVSRGDWRVRPNNTRADSGTSLGPPTPIGPVPPRAIVLTPHLAEVSNYPARPTRRAHVGLALALDLRSRLRRPDESAPRPSALFPADATERAPEHSLLDRISPHSAGPPGQRTPARTVFDSPASRAAASTPPPSVIRGSSSRLFTGPTQKPLSRRTDRLSRRVHAPFEPRRSDPVVSKPRQPRILYERRCRLDPPLVRAPCHGGDARRPARPPASFPPVLCPGPSLFQPRSQPAGAHQRPHQTTCPPPCSRAPMRPPAPLAR